MVKIENMKKIEKKVGFGHGWGTTSKSCVKIKKNIPDKDIEKYLISKEEETPKIIRFDYPNVIDVKNFESLNIIAIKMKIINHNISSIKMFLMPIKMSMIKFIAFFCRWRKH